MSFRFCNAARAAVRGRGTLRLVQRCLATEASPAAAPSVTDPKIIGLVDSISELTLLQAADLVSLLKTRLNITEIAMPAASTPVAGASAAAAAEEAPAEEKPKEKTIFNVKLEKFDAASKAKIIREVKAIMPNMNLVEAKKFVESVPKTLKENVPKEEAEKLMKTLKDLGATVILE
ncbi:54S ribosomal protein L12, mitochondrial OS=Saccharomyces cerevisiae (strain ATCC 204508 / S288c) GN=MNP1 PE=1 SV=1 [Rhizoctonia solani AG-1 IB]|uniref:54S ribosomal protein L12, mitochondrial n=2 Tax=Thanatephorus cucumeris (strain AG1-IB / isolate 7/3/14) TaxID=1108050 RepID=A0A0B7FPK4_THACB|nr:54S ribosomal protein L12, mitochondrial OS=Saccharomyces cerevisiae (strain ATCC 204508 / S288c) GN=MNP1 PE=1 SV=1 [Rhizoctonia solani AG-1 IB]